MATKGGRVRQDAGPALSRRAALGGLAAVAVAGCSRGTGPSPAPATPSSAPATSPAPHGATRLLPLELRALAADAERAFVAGDVDRLTALLGARDHRRSWSRRVAAARDVPMAVGFRFDSASLPPPSGGPVRTQVRLDVTQQVTYCDARPIADRVRAVVAKDSPTAPARVVATTAPRPAFGAMPWDLGGVAVGRLPHAIVVTSSDHEDLVARWGTVVDDAVARAMAFVAPGPGISKVLVALSWDAGSDDLLLGGWDGDLEPDAFVATAAYTLPHATGRREGRAPDGLEEDPSAGVDSYLHRDARAARVVIRTQAYSSPALPQTICHEAVHALVGPWGPVPATWIGEGLADWVALDRVAGLRADYRAVVRDGFAGFAAALRSDSFDFFAGDAFEVTRNYLCSAAVFGWIEEQWSVPRALRTAEACYRRGVADGLRSVLGMSRRRVLEDAEAWVRATW